MVFPCFHYQGFFSLFPDLCQYKNDNNLICVNIQKTQKIKIKIVKILKQNKKDLYAYLCVCVCMRVRYRLF